MDDKKSLREARERAREHSLAFPVKCYVMDKKWERARFYTVPLAVKEGILAGWHVVAVFDRGAELQFKMGDLLKC